MTPERAILTMKGEHINSNAWLSIKQCFGNIQINKTGALICCQLRTAQYESTGAQLVSSAPLSCQHPSL